MFATCTICTDLGPTLVTEDLVLMQRDSYCRTVPFLCVSVLDEGGKTGYVSLVVCELGNWGMKKDTAFPQAAAGGVPGESAPVESRMK